MTLVFISSLLVMAVGILSEFATEAHKTPVETFDMARFTLLLSSGGFGSRFYNIVSGILRGLGNSVFPLLTLLLTSCLNVILDIWFVAGLDMGYRRSLGNNRFSSRLCSGMHRQGTE